jgi:hypothetical protein
MISPRLWDAEPSSAVGEYAARVMSIATCIQAQFALLHSRQDVSRIIALLTNRVVTGHQFKAITPSVLIMYSVTYDQVD